MDSSSQFRHQLAADRMAALRRSAEHGPPSSLRRAIGARMVRLGLRLRGNRQVPTVVSNPEPPTAVATPAAVTPTRTGRA